MSSKNISVIIPSFNQPKYLDLCLNSLVTNQVENEDGIYPEVIVVVDGGWNDEYKEICTKYNMSFYENKQSFKIISNQINLGIAKSTNIGVYQATNENILIINDDNIFPPQWNKLLLDHGKLGYKVITPNQVEPYPSIYKEFYCKNFGEDYHKFDLNEWNKWNNDTTLDWSSSQTYDGGVCTLPLYMSKKVYMTVGGWDEGYPGPHVVDWDFFLKLEMLGCQFERDMWCCFYHFGGKSTKKTVEVTAKYNELELNSAVYFYYKWGFAPTNFKTGRKSPPDYEICNGIQFKYSPTETYNH